MGWPLSGNWDSISPTELPEIVAALCLAADEREQAIDTRYPGKLWPMPDGSTKRDPTAVDFEDIGINVGYQTTIYNSILASISSLSGFYCTDSTCETDWIEAGGVSAPADAALSGASPTATYTRNANRWLRLKEMFNRMIYFRSTGASTFDFSSGSASSCASEVDAFNEFSTLQEIWDDRRHSCSSGSAVPLTEYVEAGLSADEYSSYVRHELTMTYTNYSAGELLRATALLITTNNPEFTYTFHGTTDTLDGGTDRLEGFSATLGGAFTYTITLNEPSTVPFSGSASARVESGLSYYDVDATSVLTDQA